MCGTGSVPHMILKPTGTAFEVIVGRVTIKIARRKLRRQAKNNALPAALVVGGVITAAVVGSIASDLLDSSKS